MTLHICISQMLYMVPKVSMKINRRVKLFLDVLNYLYFRGNKYQTV